MAIAAIIAAFIGVVLTHKDNPSSITIGGSSVSTSQAIAIGNGQSVAISGNSAPVTQVNNFAQTPTSPQNTKQDLRTFLESLNPEILKDIDSGQSEIEVFIGTVSQMKLSNFSERQNFKSYLSFKQTSNILQGSSNKIGNSLNEVGEEGVMTGFILYPKDALKK